MSEKTDAQVAAAREALQKINDGVQDWLDAVADEGEPEVCENAVVLFEAKGMREAGIFYRRQYLIVETNGCATQMLGMLQVVGDEVQHDVMCRETHE